MPNYAFQPLVGSSFDNLGQQAFQWNQFNRGVEEGNIGRAERAQATSNDWFARSAEARQRAIDQSTQLQLQADQQAQAQQSEAAANAENRRRFDIGAKQTEEQLGIERNRYQFAQDERNKAEREQLDAIENLGKTLAPDATEATKRFKEADAAWKDVSGSLAQKAQTLIATELPGSDVAWNGRTNQIGPRTPRSILGPDVQSKLPQLNAKLASDYAEYASASAERQAAEKALGEIQKQAGRDLLVRPDGTVYSPRHDRTWGKPLKDETTTDETAGQPAPDWLAGPRFNLGASPDEQAALGATTGQRFSFAPQQETPAAPPPVTAKAMPQSQDEFDAMPSGAVFVNPADGKTYRKK